MKNIFSGLNISSGSGSIIGRDWKSLFGFFDYNSTREDTKLSEEEVSAILDDHAENDVIKEAIVYKTPLESWIPKSETFLFHAYLVYRACNKKNPVLCNWWSVEKTTEVFEIQRSENLCDVVTKRKGIPRLAEPYKNDEDRQPPPTTNSYQPLTGLPIHGLACIFLVPDVPPHKLVVGCVKLIWSIFAQVLRVIKNSYLWLINKQEPQVNRQDICKLDASPMSVFDIMREENGYKYSSKNCKRFAKRIFNKIAACKTWEPSMP